MKKFIALFALLAAGTVAQAQNLADHPNARNDRMPSDVAAQQAGSHAYRRADHRGAKHHHRKHHRKHHHKM